MRALLGAVCLALAVALAGSAAAVQLDTRTTSRQRRLLALPPPRPPPRPRPPSPKPEPPPRPKPPQPRPPPRPRPRPPPKPKPPRPPPSPRPPLPRPPPSTSLPPALAAEAAWHQWLRHLHSLSRFSSPTVSQGSSSSTKSIAKLLPQSFWYRLLVKDGVPGGTAGANAADVWSNSVLTYDSLWLRPDAALLSDSLSLLHMDAESAGMVPAGALSALGRATSRSGPDPGYTAAVSYNPNNEFVPGFMPAWAFDGTAFAGATQQAKALESKGTRWAASFTFNASSLASTVSWAPYTLDGSPTLRLPPGMQPTDPLAWPGRHFLDVSASDLGRSHRVDLVPGVTTFRCDARGFFFGPLGPTAKWFNASAWAGPFPATPAATSRANQYFAARSGFLPTVPQAVAAMYSPTVRFWLRPQAYADLKIWWQNVTTGGTRRLDVLAWSVKKGDATTGNISFSDTARRVTITPPGGRWYRVAQVQAAVAPTVFLAGLG